MAIASTSIDFPFNSAKNESAKESGSLSNKLDFYEAMYHFKKMFPKFDSDVIETILRSNSGSVDKTLDQLLAISVDSDNASPTMSSHSQSHNSCLLTTELNASNDLHDLPPPYHEIMSSSSISSNSDSSKTKYDDLIDFNNNYIPENPIRSSLNSIHSEPGLGSKTSLKQTYHSSPSFIRNYNQLLVGDLSKDFLRIKLTKDQVNSYRNSIKVAKRDEIAAILNNKTPKHPELSFELKRQLDALMSQLEENETDLEDWQEKYKNLLQSFENKRLQIIQDEYLAKLLQNEEFLNEIRTDQDFIDTLNHETNTVNEFDYDLSRKYKNHDYTNKTLSNAELMAKLSNMGKVSKAKLNKLASKYLTKRKSSKSSKGAIEFNSIDFNSLDEYPTKSSLKSDDYSLDINENTTYDLERIKAEEFNSGTLGKSNNRYKKAYKSLKTAITRNNSSHSPAGSFNDINGYKGSYDYNKNNFY